MAFALALGALACGGQSHQTKVEEVPIDQGGGPGDTPTDSTSNAQTVIPSSDASAPPGVGPQSLDVQAQAQDAGAATSTTFSGHAGGLTEKQCNDLVLHFAKLMTKEHKNPTPTAADLPKDPIYGQMMNDCGQSTTKKQQKCGMTSHTTAGWKKCME
jgi:hypothetical protein